MLLWFLDKLGISQELTGKLEQVQLLWARPTVLLAGLILLLPAAFYIVLRHRNNLPHVSRPVRNMLSVCRIGILLLLVLVLGGPYLRLDEPISNKPLLFWLVDDSESMTLPVGNYGENQTVAIGEAAGMIEKNPDGSAVPIDANIRKELFNLNRAELLNRVLEKNKPLLDQLKERFDFRSYHFARNLEPGSLENRKQPVETISTERKDTDIGNALDEVIDQMAGQKSAGIVVLTDGHSTIGPDPVQVIRRQQTVTTEAAGVPVWTIPVGSTEPLIDVTLLDVLSPAQVALKDTAVLVATVGSHGFGGRNVTVRLMEQEILLDETDLTLSEGDRQQVQLKFEADRPGIRLLTVEVDNQGEEQVQTNNRVGVTIEVDEQRWKVLYLEGYPRWDFRFLDYALRRDQGLEVTMVVEDSLAAEKQEGATGSLLLPTNITNLSEYDVVMLGDITPALLGKELQQELVRAVEEDGLGLIIQAGPRAMPHSFTDGPLARLLPVTFPDGENNSRVSVGGIAAPAYAPFQMTVTSQGSIHPAFRLYDSATQNRAIWSRMPPFYWTSAEQDAKPAATVLAECTAMEKDRRPLIAEQFVGAGRVVFIGTDATYRWRAYIGDPLFSRFWGQVIRHVALSHQKSGENNWLEVYPARVEVGESVSVELYALDADGNPLKTSEINARVVKEGKTDSVILKTSTEPGHFHGTWMGREEGEYVFTVDAGGQNVSATARVAKSNRELMRPDVDRDTLGTLAELSKGGLLELNEIGTLSQKLKGEVRTVNRIHEDEIWDNWFTLVLLVSLYCMDVFVRRMSGLT